MSKLSGETWELTLADKWQAEANEDCITITHPQGVGALQISAFQKKHGQLISLEELQWQVIEHSPIPQSHLAKLQEQQWGQFSDLQVIYAMQGTFWRKWWLRHANTLLFVTYNCEQKSDSVETAAVNGMMSTLRYTDALQQGIQPDGPASGGSAG
jgi:hypothetical protein